MTRATTISIVLCIACLVSAAGAMPYAVTFLDDGSAVGSTACDINNSGLIAGTGSDAPTEFYTAIYGLVWNTDGTSRKIYGAPGYSARVTSVSAISDSGKVVGTAATGEGQDAYAASWGSDARYASLLPGSDPPPFTHLPPYTPSIESMACSVNSSGRIAGYYSVPSGFPLHHACVWDSSGGIIDLNPSESDRSAAYGINNAGTVVGSTGSSSGLACKWDSNGNRTDLALPTGAGASVAACINDSGIIAGVWSVPLIFYREGDYSTESVAVGGGNSHACVWGTDGSVRTLDVLSGFTYSVVSDINSSGQVVGYCLGTQQRACMWNPDGSVVDLGLGAGSAALGINDVGQIVGWSSTSTGRAAVLWNPVPEPSAMFALVAGLFGVGVLRVRGRRRG